MMKLRRKKEAEHSSFNMYTCGKFGVFFFFFHTHIPTNPLAMRYKPRVLNVYTKTNGKEIKKKKYKKLLLFYFNFFVFCFVGFFYIFFAFLF